MSRCGSLIEAKTWFADLKNSNLIVVEGKSWKILKNIEEIFILNINWF